MKALGLTAMILAIIAIFVPILGPYLTVLVALLAAFSGGPGLTFGIVALIINAVNIFLLSPSLWLAAGLLESSESGMGADMLATVGKFLLGAQVVAAIVLAIVHSSLKKVVVKA